MPCLSKGPKLFWTSSKLFWTRPNCLDMSLKAKFISGNIYIFGPIKNSLIQCKTIWTGQVQNILD